MDGEEDEVEYSYDFEEAKEEDYLDESPAKSTRKSLRGKTYAENIANVTNQFANMWAFYSTKQY